MFAAVLVFNKLVSACLHRLGGGECGVESEVAEFFFWVQRWVPRKVVR